MAPEILDPRACRESLYHDSLQARLTEGTDFFRYVKIQLGSEA